MLLTNTIVLPSGDHDGCAAFAAGSPAPPAATDAPVCGSTSDSVVPALMRRRDASALNVENSAAYDAPPAGASVGAGLPCLTAGSLMSKTAPLSPPPHSSPAR